MATAIRSLSSSWTPRPTLSRASIIVGKSAPKGRRHIVDGQIRGLNFSMSAPQGRGTDEKDKQGERASARCKIAAARSPLPAPACRSAPSIAMLCFLPACLPFLAARSWFRPSADEARSTTTTGTITTTTTTTTATATTTPTETGTRRRRRTETACSASATTTNVRKEAIGGLLDENVRCVGEPKVP